ncbi:MAG: transglycosylase family protein [Gaiellaceae bacterium]
MRAVLVTGLAALLLAWPAAATNSGPSAAWLLQAECVHLKEGPWSANTGNGYFGGFQFKAVTWKRAGGAADAAFTHPGNPAYPFHASAREQLYRAWLTWRSDGRTWRSWGAIGVSCS